MRGRKGVGNVVWFFIYGLVFGSFAKVCIDRWRAGEHLGGRSRCPHCAHQLTAKELVPMVSFLRQKGRCRACGAPIGWAYPLTELFCGVLFAGCAAVFDGWARVYFCAVLLLLFIIAGIDAKSLEIPDICNLLLLVLALARPLTGALSWSAAMVGAAVVALPLAIIGWLTGGIGGGDVKLMAAMGLMLGPAKIILAFFLGCVAAAVWALGAMYLGRLGRKDYLPLAPFLALGLSIAIFGGDKLTNWYLRGFFV